LPQRWPTLSRRFLLDDGAKINERCRTQHVRKYSVL